MHAIVHPADIQDRDGGVLVMATLFGLYPFLLKLYADGGYAGDTFQAGVKRCLKSLDVEIVKRSDKAKGFVVLPKRWIVERTFAWLCRCRRLAKDLGAPQPQSPRLPQTRINPPHAQETLQSNVISPDRLLEAPVRRRLPRRPNQV